jgi:hypothetical protein
MNARLPDYALARIDCSALDETPNGGSKLARAMEIPLCQLFYDGEEPPQVPNLLKQKSSDKDAWGSTGKDARFLSRLRRLLGKSSAEDRKLLLHMAQKMAGR